MSDRLEAAVAELVAALRSELAADSAAQVPDRLMSVDEAADALGLGRSKVYSEIASGRLGSLRVGRRRLIAAGAIREYIREADGTS